MNVVHMNRLLPPVHPLRSTSVLRHRSDGVHSAHCGERTSSVFEMSTCSAIPVMRPVRFLFFFASLLHAVFAQQYIQFGNAVNHHSNVKPEIQVPVTAAQLPLDFFGLTTNGRQTLSGDGYGGEGYTVLPVLRDEPPATVIIIHGLGGTGEEWGYVSLAMSFFALNYVKFIIPRAPYQYVTYLDEEIPSWYDIRFIRDYQTSVNNTQLLESVDRIHDIIRAEINVGVQSNRIAIVGFSQGGGLALTAFLRSPFELAGCVGVATWLPNDDLYPTNLSPTVADKQVLLLHVSFKHRFCAAMIVFCSHR